MALDAGVPILDADYLSRMDAAEARRIFSGSVDMPMLEERAAIMREVGTVLKRKYGGSFHNLVKRAGYKAFDRGNGIVERLVRDFPSFNDVETYEGREVKLYKRAQLAVAMSYSRLRGTGLFDVRDIAALTVFADYVLPRGLRKLGILEYSPELSGEVDRRELIPAGSPEEVEIRAKTVWAAKLLQDELNRRGKPADALSVDFFIWGSGKDDSTPHHLTETTAY
jgi:hypothetical protein